MILTCTVCQTTYYAEPSTIGADGRQVKCASCGHTWHVDASGIEAQPKAQATSAAHTSYLRTVHERHVKRSRAAALAAWAVVGAAAVTIVAAGLVNRHAVVDRWPQAASAYGLVGLTVNRFGVEFENVERRRDMREDPKPPIMSAFAEGETALHLGTLEKELSEKPYIMGDAFQIPDIGISYIVSMADRLGELGPYPALQAYWKRNQERAAWKRAVEKAVE